MVRNLLEYDARDQALRQFTVRLEIMREWVEHINNVNKRKQDISRLKILRNLLLYPGERTLTMLAVAIGAGFATFENCCYILTAGAESLPYILIRGMAVGVMHIVSILALPIWLIAFALYFLLRRLPRFTES